MSKKEPVRKKSISTGELERQLKSFNLDFSTTSGHVKRSSLGSPLSTSAFIDEGDLLKAKNNLLAVRRKSVGDEGKALSEGEDAPEDSLPIGVLEPRKRGNFPESGKPLSSSLLVQKPIIEGILYVENSSW